MTLEQLHLLGRYESRAVIEANAIRHVDLGFFDELEPGNYAPADEFREASINVLQLQARVAEDLWSTTSDLVELAAVVGAVVDRVVPPIPAPAFSAQRTDHAAVPTSPAGQVLAFITELRYLRSDIHAHALAVQGFYGPTARVVDRAWKGHDLTADEIRHLQDKQLVVNDEAGWRISDTTVRKREHAQASTESASAAALDDIPEGDRTVLLQALRRLPGDDPRPAIDR